MARSRAGRMPDIRARTAARRRPEGSPVMRQSWGQALFLHWRAPAADIQSLLPRRLRVDTYDGSAWVGITPFTLWDVRLPFMPAIPRLSEFHEVNLRTYVHLDGEPGVWFFSLDANSLLATLAADIFYSLPYRLADITLDETDGTVEFAAERREEPAAWFSASWTVGKKLPSPRPGSLEYFLIERYALYAFDESTLYRARIAHRPWPLNEARLEDFDTNLFEAEDLPVPTGKPLAHSGGPVSVDIWPLQAV